MHTLKRVVEFRIRVLVKRIQIRADCAREKDWILWYNRNAAPQVVETDLRNIDAVDVYGAFACLEEAEQSQCE